MLRPSAILFVLLGASALAAPAVFVRSGSAKGTWNLPSSSATPGKMFGVLTNDATGQALYTIQASLTFTPSPTAAIPHGGTMKGFLYPITPTASIPVPSHEVVGFFTAQQLPVETPFPVYAGKFAAKLKSLSPVASPISLDGTIEGTFFDPLPTDGNFTAKWKIGF